MEGIGLDATYQCVKCINSFFFLYIIWYPQAKCISIKRLLRNIDVVKNLHIIVKLVVFQ